MKSAARDGDSAGPAGSRTAGSRRGLLGLGRAGRRGEDIKERRCFFHSSTVGHPTDIRGHDATASTAAG